jgi:hypothetical protein
MVSGGIGYNGWRLSDMQSSTRAEMTTGIGSDDERHMHETHTRGEKDKEGTVAKMLVLDASDEPDG